MAINMVTVSFSFLIVVHTVAISKIMQPRVKAGLFIQTVMSTLGNGRMTKRMGMALISLPMEENIKESGNST